MQKLLVGTLHIDQATLELLLTAETPIFLNAAVNPSTSANNHVARMRAIARLCVGETSLKTFDSIKKDVKMKDKAAKIITSFFKRYVKPKQESHFEPVKEMIHPHLELKSQSHNSWPFEGDNNALLVEMYAISEVMVMLNEANRLNEIQHAAASRV
jgi:hypothetical protein